MRVWLLLVLLLPLTATAQNYGYQGYAGAGGPAVETEVALPPFPQPENYIPFQLDLPSPFHFYIDARSIKVMDDGALQFAVIAKSAEGALNIDFEGMRCADKEYRIFAYGRSDKTWSEAKRSRWQPIRGEASNAHRAALYRNYFCSERGSVTSVEQAISSLKSGGVSSNETTKY